MVTRTVANNPARPPIRRSSSRRWSRTLWLAALAFLLVLVAVWLSLGRSPAFYRAALAVDSASSRVLGDQFEELVLDWTNQTKRLGEWQVEISAKQANGWMAVDMVEKFPGTVPEAFRDPRFDIQPGELSLAVQWKWGWLGGVAVIRTDVFCTSSPSEIALRFKRANTGWVPLPLRRIGDSIAAGLQRADCQTRWSEIDNDPVLLILPPAKYRQLDGARVDILSITTGPGTLLIQGSTRPN